MTAHSGPINDRAAGLLEAAEIGHSLIDGDNPCWDNAIMQYMEALTERAATVEQTTRVKAYCEYCNEGPEASHIHANRIYPASPQGYALGQTVTGGYIKDGYHYGGTPMPTEQATRAEGGESNELIALLEQYYHPNPAGYVSAALIPTDMAKRIIAALRGGTKERV